MRPPAKRLERASIPPYRRPMARAACLLALVIGFGVLATGCADDKPCRDLGLYLVRPDGSDLHRVRPNGGAWPAHDGEVVGARWLPGAKRLVVQRADYCPSPLLTMRADGSDVRVSATDAPGFAAAGTSLSWVHAFRPTGFRVSQSGAPPRVVRFHEGFEIFPCSDPEPIPQVSPDGRFVVYADGTTPTATELYVLDVARRTAPRRVWRRDARPGLMSIVWSPDSRTIAVRSDRIYLIDVERPSPRSIPIAGADLPLAWSPSGRILAVSGSSGLELIDLHGNVLRNLVKGDIFDISWAPANMIAFIQDTGDSDQAKCRD